MFKIYQFIENNMTEDVMQPTEPAFQPENLTKGNKSRYRLLGVIVAAVSTVYVSGRAVATRMMLDSSPRVVPIADRANAGYREVPVDFKWNNETPMLTQLVFDPNPEIEEQRRLPTTFIVPGNRMPSGYTGYVALAEQIASRGGKGIIAALPDNAGEGTVDGRNDWGTAEQAVALGTQIINEMDLQVLNGNGIVEINFSTESMGTTALANSLPMVIEHIKALKARNPELTFNFDIVADSPVLDTAEVIIDGAGRFIPIAAPVLRFFASQAIDNYPGEFDHLTPELIAKLFNGVARVANVRMVLITAEGDTTARATNADLFIQALSRKLKFRHLSIPDSTPAGKWHVPGVLYFNPIVQTLDPNVEISRKDYLAYILNPKALGQFIDDMFGDWSDDRLRPNSKARRKVDNIPPKNVGSQQKGKLADNRPVYY